MTKRRISNTELHENIQDIKDDVRFIKDEIKNDKVGNVKIHTKNIGPNTI